MKTNAFTRNHTRLFRVWGDDGIPPYLDLPDGTAVFVCYSPTLRQWVMSISNIDYRYDSLVSTSNFLLDQSLLPTGDPSGPSYYLNRYRATPE